MFSTVSGQHHCYNKWDRGNSAKTKKREHKAPAVIKDYLRGRQVAFGLDDVELPGGERIRIEMYKAVWRLADVGS